MTSSYIISRRNNNPISLDSFRSDRFSKIVSVTTLFFFVWTTCLSRPAFAINEKINEQQVRQAQFDAMYEKTPEEKLSYRLQKLKNKVTRDIPEQMHENQGGVFNKTLSAIGLKGLPIDEDMLDEISVIETSIREAEQGGLKGFEDDEQQIRNNKKLSKEIKQRAR